jgi:drug/metabolite transporter (DMT)-like permease
MNCSPYLLLTLTNLFFGLNIIIAKVVTGVIPPISLTLLRWSGSFIILLPFCWRKLKANRTLFLSKWPLILALGAIGYSFSSIMAYEAVRYSTAVNVSFINAFVPIMVALAGYVFCREPVTKPQILGFILSLIGVFWIIFQGDCTNMLKFKVNTGDLFMLINIMVWPIFLVLYKQKASNLPRLAMLECMFFAGILFTVPPAIVENVIVHGAWLRQIRWNHVLGIIGLCIFPSILANQFQNTAVKYVAANKVGIFQYLIPVFSSAIAVLFLGEKLYFYHLCGGLLILAGVFLVVGLSLDKLKNSSRNL